MECPQGRAGADAEPPIPGAPPGDSEPPGDRWSLTSACASVVSPVPKRGDHWGTLNLTAIHPLVRTYGHGLCARHHTEEAPALNKLRPLVYFPSCPAG